MRFVACSGFPIPVSRYFREFPAVEISDSELGLPGEGTVRRWKREAPKGYGFTLIAPKSLSEAGWKKAPETKELCAALADLGHELDAKAIVFNGGEDFKFSKVAKETLKGFVKSLPAKFPAVVFDLPAWKTDQIAGIDDRVVAAYDPLRDDRGPEGDFSYVRLPGPAGHRSRYDEASVDRIVEHLATIKSATTFCVFRNIDMHANASLVLKKWK